MKKIFSKRWLGNLLIVLFGLVVLFITSLVVYKEFFISADTTNVFVGNGQDQQFNFSYSADAIDPSIKYQIVNIPAFGTSFKFLEIIDQTAVDNALGAPTDSGDITTFPHSHPAYEVPYIHNLDVENSETKYMAIVPMPPYQYTWGRIANTSSATYKLLIAAKSFAQGNDSNRATINTAISQYESAAKLASSNFIIDDTSHTLITKDSNILAQCTGAPTDCDPDVQPATFDASSDQDYYNAFKISVDPNFHYQQPAANSLTLKIFNSALSNAQSSSVQDTTSVPKLNSAKANYQRQIPGNSASGGLTLSSIATIQHNESQTVSFSLDMAKLVLPTNGATLQTLLLNIDEKTFCTISFRGDSNSPDTTNSPGCVWNSTPANFVYSGSFTWDQNTGQNLGTGVPSSSSGRILALKAFDSNHNSLVSVSKNVVVLPGTGSDTTTGGGVIPIKLIVPQSVDKSKADASKQVQIKISASNLKGTPPVEKIAWYICKGTQTTITGNDSTGCDEKEKFGPFAQDSFKDKVVTWDASESAVGTYVVMAKAFGAPTSPNVYPDYPGATKVVSSNITVVENMGDNNTSGGSDGGGSITADWAANFQKSSIDTIDKLLKLIGPFSLYILGFLAVIAIIIAGMKYITSAGDPKGAEVGKKGVLFAIYGIVGATLCVVLIRTTISEVQKIIGTILPDPSNPGTILPTQLGGPNASMMDIIGHDSGIIWRIIQLAVYYAEVVAVFYILYASFLYLTSYGDDSKAEGAKKTIIWAVIGLAFILSANILINIFGQALK
ncbi:MAG: pilin [Candidatus Berkelbacteria bacterium]|nr:pilin [Candidatus Berkelbacteria bacterium]